MRVDVARARLHSGENVFGENIHLGYLGVAFTRVYDRQGTVIDHDPNIMSYIDGRNKEIKQHMK